MLTANTRATRARAFLQLVGVVTRIDLLNYIMEGDKVVHTRNVPPATHKHMRARAPIHTHLCTHMRPSTHIHQNAKISTYVIYVAGTHAANYIVHLILQPFATHYFLSFRVRSERARFHRFSLFS